MNLELSEEQARLLREALHSRLAHLERELIRTDSREFRQELRAYMAAVEQLLHQLTFRTEAEETYA